MFFKYICILGTFYRIVTFKFCNVTTPSGDQTSNWIDRTRLELNKQFLSHLWAYFGTFCTLQRASHTFFLGDFQYALFNKLYKLTIFGRSVPSKIKDMYP
jgi:hypothetical protein